MLMQHLHSVPKLAKRSLDGSIEIPTIDNNEAIRAASRTFTMSPRKAASSSALSMLDTTK
jgi:U3 small nucleolar ribonucleoprotein component